MLTTPGGMPDSAMSSAIFSELSGVISAGFMIKQLPAASAVKKSALRYKTAYEAAYGAGSISTFGGHAWDAGQLLANAIPQALKTAQPGTREFRSALRDALENTKDLAVSQGIVNTTPKDHLGFDQRSRVMVQVTNGKWKLVGDTD